MFLTVPSRITPSSRTLRISFFSVSRSFSSSARRETTTLPRARLNLRIANLSRWPRNRSRLRVGRMSTCEPGRNAATPRSTLNPPRTLATITPSTPLPSCAAFSMSSHTFMFSARALDAPAVSARAARRSHPRLRRALGRRSEHRPGGGAAHGLRTEGPRLDRDAQLRLGHAGGGLGDQQHPGRPLAARARRRRRRALSCAVALRGPDGALVLRYGRGENRGAKNCLVFASTLQILAGACDRHHERAHRPDGGPAHGSDRREPGAPLRHHARAAGCFLGPLPPSGRQGPG